MIIKKNALVNSGTPKKGTVTVLERASAGKDISSMPQDVIKHVRMLMIENGLSLEDIIKRYKEIVNMKLHGTKVSDVVKVLENVQRIHLAQSSTLNDNYNALVSQNPEELAEYTRVTLSKTQVILERLQAKKINQNAVINPDVS